MKKRDNKAYKWFYIKYTHRVTWIFICAICTKSPIGFNSIKQIKTKAFQTFEQYFLIALEPTAVKYEISILL